MESVLEHMIASCDLNVGQSWIDGMQLQLQQVVESESIVEYVAPLFDETLIDLNGEPGG